MGSDQCFRLMALATTKVSEDLEDGTRISYRAESPPPGLYAASWRGARNLSSRRGASAA